MDPLTNNLISDTDITEPQHSKRFLTAKEAAADYFHGTVSYWKLLDMAKQNLIPHIRMSGRILFRPDSLDQWLTVIENQPNANMYPEAQKRLSS